MKKMILFLICLLAFSYAQESKQVRLILPKGKSGAVSFAKYNLITKQYNDSSFINDQSILIEKGKSIILMFSTGTYVHKIGNLTINGKLVPESKTIPGHNQYYDTPYYTTVIFIDSVNQDIVLKYDLLKYSNLFATDTLFFAPPKGGKYDWDSQGFTNGMGYWLHGKSTDALFHIHANKGWKLDQILNIPNDQSRFKQDTLFQYPMRGQGLEKVDYRTVTEYDTAFNAWVWGTRVIHPKFVPVDSFQTEGLGAINYAEIYDHFPRLGTFSQLDSVYINGKGEEIWQSNGMGKDGTEDQGYKAYFNLPFESRIDYVYNAIANVRLDNNKNCPAAIYVGDSLVYKSKAYFSDTAKCNPTDSAVHLHITDYYDGNPSYTQKFNIPLDPKEYIAKKPFFGHYPFIRTAKPKILFTTDIHYLDTSTQTSDKLSYGDSTIDNPSSYLSNAFLKVDTKATPWKYYPSPGFKVKRTGISYRCRTFADQMNLPINYEVWKLPMDSGYVKADQNGFYISGFGVQDFDTCFDYSVIQEMTSLDDNSPVDTTVIQTIKPFITDPITVDAANTPSLPPIWRITALKNGLDIDSHQDLKALWYNSKGQILRTDVVKPGNQYLAYPQSGVLFFELSNNNQSLVKKMFVSH